MPAPENIQENRQQNQAPLDRLKPFGTNVQINQGGADGLKQDRAQQGADDRAGAAQDADAADNRRGDHRQFKTGSHVRLDRREVRGVQDR